MACDRLAVQYAKVTASVKDLVGSEEGRQALRRLVADAFGVQPDKLEVYTTSGAVQFTLDSLYYRSAGGAAVTIGADGEVTYVFSRTAYSPEAQAAVREKVERPIPVLARVVAQTRLAATVKKAAKEVVADTRDPKTGVRRIRVRI